MSWGSLVSSIKILSFKNIGSELPGFTFLAVYARTHAHTHTYTHPQIRTHKCWDVPSEHGETQGGHEAGRDAFAWQTRQDTVEAQKTATFDQWLKPRQIALRSLLWEVCCDAYT